MKYYKSKNNCTVQIGLDKKEEQNNTKNDIKLHGRCISGNSLGRGGSIVREGKGISGIAGVGHI